MKKFSIMICIWFCWFGHGLSWPRGIEQLKTKLPKDAFSPAELGAPLDRGKLKQPDLKLLDALEKNDTKAAQEALRSGADPNLDCGYRVSPLMIAASKRNQDVVRILTESGARQTDEAKPYLELLTLNTRNKNEDFQRILKSIATIVGRPVTIDEKYGTYVFEMPALKKNEFLKKHHESLLKHGYIVLGYDYRNVTEIPDKWIYKLMILPTDNKFTAMALIGVNGDKDGINNFLVIRWMMLLEKREPYNLFGCGEHYMNGPFKRKIKNPDQLAKELVTFCPGVLGQIGYTTEDVAEHLRQYNNLYLWWWWF